MRLLSGSVRGMSSPIDGVRIRSQRSAGAAECVRVFGAISSIAREWIKFLGHTGWAGHFNQA